MELYQRVRMNSNKYSGDGIPTGAIGFIVEIYDDGVCEVEFSRDDGTTYAMRAIDPAYFDVLDQTVLDGSGTLPFVAGKRIRKETAMRSNTSKYQTFTRYAVIWMLYFILTLMYPGILSLKLYLFVGIPYLIITHFLYKNQICAYLLSKHPSECLKAVARRYPPDGFNEENFATSMSLVAFNEGYRRRIFDRSDTDIKKIYSSNMLKATFSVFMEITLAIAFFYNYWI